MIRGQTLNSESTNSVSVRNLLFDVGCLVGLGESVSAVHDGVGAVGADRSMDEISLVARALFKIGDHVMRRVVRGNAVRERKVSLPDVNNPRRLGQSQVVVVLVWSGRHAVNADGVHLMV